MHTRKIREKYREFPYGCGTLEPRPNHATPPGRYRWHSEFDLDLEGGLGNSEKIKKNGKTVHGVMVSDASPRKNTNHAIPRVHRWTLS
jgi:hypothetical protein